MATTANGARATKVVTGVVRLSYAHLFEPFSPNEEQDKKYSTVILVPKKDKKTIADIERAQQAALEAGKDSRFGGKIPRNWKNTFRDGDTDDAVDHETNPEYAGHMFMTVSSKTRPGIIDRQKMEILDSSEVYSGCYARISMNAFPFNTQGNKGVSFGLNHVQKVRDGEMLGGRSRAEDDFEELDEEDGDEDEDLLG